VRGVAFLLVFAITLSSQAQVENARANCALRVSAEYQTDTRDFAAVYRDVVVTAQPDLAEISGMILELRLAGLDRFQMKLRFLLDSDPSLLDRIGGFWSFLDSVRQWSPENEIALATSDPQYAKLQDRIESLEDKLDDHPDRAAYDSFSSGIRHRDPYILLFREADEARKAAWGHANAAFSRCTRPAVPD
jgi:hypothetical protein